MMILPRQARDQHRETSKKDRFAAEEEEGEYSRIWLMADDISRGLSVCLSDASGDASDESSRSVVRCHADSS
jgi:hypothetical protein